MFSFMNVGLPRRDFLRIGTAGLLGMNIADALRQSTLAAPTAPARNVIVLFLTGGPATIDMWDMKPDAPEHVRGEFRPIETAMSGVQICQHLPRLAKVMDLATLVRSVTHTIAEHTEGQRYVMTGNRPSPAVAAPSLGSAAASLLANKNGVPAYMTIGSVPASGAGDLGLNCDPFQIGETGNRENAEGDADRIGLPTGFSVADLERRRKLAARLDRRFAGLPASELPAQLDRFGEQAFEILRSNKIHQATQWETEDAAVREQYGSSMLGRHLLTARRLIEAGTRFVTVGHGDWDTHANNFMRMQTTLLPQLDQALAALLADLRDRGLLNDTIVYCTGEFGRTPVVNGTVGRDHWAHTMTALLAGGGFHRGGVYGATDETGSEPITDACSPDDLSATIFQQLGFAPAHALQTRSGRPVPLFRNGKPIAGLVNAG